MSTPARWAVDRGVFRSWFEDALTALVFAAVVVTGFVLVAVYSGWVALLVGAAEVRRSG
jgi:hypothetical protein